MIWGPGAEGLPQLTRQAMTAFAIIEANTSSQIEAHKTAAAANQAANEINARWGAGEVFVKQIKVASDYFTR
jgi:hypothetical protein